jgi:hypothetical protein
MCAAFSVAPFATMLVTPDAALAAGSVTFTDPTFNLSDYTAPTTFTSGGGATINVVNCSACGPTSGEALQFQVDFPNSNESVDAGLVNNTFAYNPGTEGAIGSISASVDKDFTFDPAESNGFTSTFHPLIEQGGLFYEAAISGLSSPSGTSVTTQGYATIAQSGLTAADFDLVDLATGVIGTAHPNFSSGGGSLLFGIAQISGAGSYSGTDTIDYANLDLTISPAPEPSTWALMLFGVFGLGAALRSQRRKAMSLAA